MGNYRFKLSDMMPNAWFYKLKEMGSRSRNHHHHQSTTTHSSKKKQTSTLTSSASTPTPPHLYSKPKHPHHHHLHHHNHYSYPRKSYYFTRELIPTDRKLDPPRKSSKQRLIKKRTTISSSSPKFVPSSVSAESRYRATIWSKSSDSPPDYSASSSDTSPESDLDSLPPEFRSDCVLATESLAWSSSCECKVNDCDANDIIIDKDKKSLDNKLDISDLDLPPIITKPAKFDGKVASIKNTSRKYRKSSAKYKETNANGSSLSVKVVKEEEETVTTKEHRNIKRNSSNSPGLRLRVNSPRIGSRRIIQGRKSASSSSRKSLLDSLAIVKSSFDPQRDFMESMVEMIVENNIRASKDLEDLLACYLSLNSDEYHGLIIKVFKQIWFDLTETQSK